VLICEGDLIGKSREELGFVRFRQDRDRLQSRPIIAAARWGSGECGGNDFLRTYN
jgi:hypothetical protein